MEHGGQLVDLGWHRGVVHSWLSSRGHSIFVLVLWIIGVRDVVLGLSFARGGLRPGLGLRRVIWYLFNVEVSSPIIGDAIGFAPGLDTASPCITYMAHNSMEEKFRTADTFNPFVACLDHLELRNSIRTIATGDLFEHLSVKHLLVHFCYNGS